jgi:hypothetical protein
MSKYLVQAGKANSRTPAEKTCILCRIRKPAAEFQQYPHKTKGGNDAIRLKPRCNPCMKAYQPRTPSEKTCILCRIRKPAAEFLKYAYKTTQGKNGVRLDSRCTVCLTARYRERAKEWAGKYPEKIREYQARYRAKPETKRWRRDHHLSIRYGITLEQYESDYKKQTGKCLICSQEFGKLCVDHCHATGKYRGLLCDACNQAVGKLQDSPELCEKAAEYLRQGM